MGYTESGECELKEWANSGYDDSNSVKYIFANLSDIAYKHSKDKHNALKKAFPSVNSSPNSPRLTGNSIEYNVIRILTNRDITSFWDHDCKKVIMAFRGTDIANKLDSRLRDLYIDFYLAVGKLKKSTRYKEAKTMLDKVISTYGKNNIILTGHSLGGAIASHLSTDYQIPSITFNTGSSPIIATNKMKKHPFKTEFTTNDPKKGIIDPLSVSSYVFNDQKNIIIQQKEGESAHTIRNFT